VLAGIVKAKGRKPEKGNGLTAKDSDGLMILIVQVAAVAIIELFIIFKADRIHEK